MPRSRSRSSRPVGVVSPLVGCTIENPEYPSSPPTPLNTWCSPGRRRSCRAAPHVSATQWTGHVPPSLAKCGVTGGCQSCVVTTSALRRAAAAATSRLTTSMTSSAPDTYRLPSGWAKSFCTSTTRRAGVLVVGDRHSAEATGTSDQGGATGRTPDYEIALGHGHPDPVVCTGVRGRQGLGVPYRNARSSPYDKVRFSPNPPPPPLSTSRRHLSLPPQASRSAAWAATCPPAERDASAIAVAPKEWVTIVTDPKS